MPVNILDALRLDLGPTKTYPRRECVWLPGSDGTDERDGTLTINLQRGRTSSSKLESDTYAVQESPALGGEPAGCRSFLLVNLTDPEADEVYETYLAADPAADLCTCTAGKCKVESGCKHRDAIRAVIDAGGLDPDDGPAACLTPATRDWSHVEADFA